MTSRVFFMLHYIDNKIDIFKTNQKSKKFYSKMKKNPINGHRAMLL